MSKGRSDRRHHHERMRKYVEKFYWLNPKHYWGSEEDRQLHIRKMAETRHPCSCYMCGNPRRWHKDKLTMQEKKIKEHDLE